MKPRLRLHSKLYRARAIDQSIKSTGESAVRFTRRRQGQYHVIEARGPAAPDDGEILADIGDMALLLTVELDRSPTPKTSSGKTTPRKKVG